MKSADIVKLADFLSETIDSHGVYYTDVFDHLEGARVRIEAPDNTVIGGTRTDPALVLEFGGERLLIPTATGRETIEAIKARGLGGSWDDDLERQQFTITGYIMSTALARQITGSADGDRFTGRGTRHDHNIAGLRKFAAAAE